MMMMMMGVRTLIVCMVVLIVVHASRLRSPLQTRSVSQYGTDTNIAATAIAYREREAYLERQLSLVQDFQTKKDRTIQVSAQLARSDLQTKLIQVLLKDKEEKGLQWHKLQQQKAQEKNEKMRAVLFKEKQQDKKALNMLHMRTFASDELQELMSVRNKRRAAELAAEKEQQNAVNFKLIKAQRQTKCQQKMMADMWKLNNQNARAVAMQRTKTILMQEQAEEQANRNKRIQRELAYEKEIRASDNFKLSKAKHQAKCLERMMADMWRSKLEDNKKVIKIKMLRAAEQEKIALR